MIPKNPGYLVETIDFVNREKVKQFLFISVDFVCVCLLCFNVEVSQSSINDSD